MPAVTANDMEALVKACAKKTSHVLGSQLSAAVMLQLTAHDGKQHIPEILASTAPSKSAACATPEMRCTYQCSRTHVFPMEPSLSKVQAALCDWLTHIDHITYKLLISMAHRTTKTALSSSKLEALPILCPTSHLLRGLPAQGNAVLTQSRVPLHKTTKPR